MQGTAQLRSCGNNLIIVSWHWSSLLMHITVTIAAHVIYWWSLSAQSQDGSASEGTPNTRATAKRHRRAWDKYQCPSAGGTNSCCRRWSHSRLQSGPNWRDQTLRLKQSVKKRKTLVQNMWKWSYLKTKHSIRGQWTARSQKRMSM